MNARAPTLDHLFLGIVAGAGVGGITFPLSWYLRAGEFPDFGDLVANWVGGAAGLLLYLPVVFVPIWWVVQLVGLRGPVGGAVAGALSFTAPLMLLSLFFRNRWSWSEIDTALMNLAALGAPGVLMGLAIWRVSNCSVDADSNMATEEAS